MGVLMGIGFLFLSICFFSMLIVYPMVSKKTLKRLCILMFVLGVVGFTSICISARSAEKIEKKTTYEEYGIQKATTTQVYFNDFYKMSYKDVTVKKPVEKYNNLVVVKTEYFKTRWLWFKFKYSVDKYYVYFSDSVYQEYLKDRNVIYEE